MNDHVGKPIERATLYDNVRRWLPRTQAHKTRIGSGSSNFNTVKFDEFVDVVGVERAERIATSFLKELTAAFPSQCTLGEAQQAVHALVNCAGVLGFENLVVACRALEFVSCDDSITRSWRWNRSEGSNRRRAKFLWATCCRNCARVPTKPAAHSKRGHRVEEAGRGVPPNYSTRRAPPRPSAPAAGDPAVFCGENFPRGARQDLAKPEKPGRQFFLLPNPLKSHKTAKKNWKSLEKICTPRRSSVTERRRKRGPRFRAHDPALRPSRPSADGQSNS